MHITLLNINECTMLQSIVLHYTALHCTVMYCTTLKYTVLDYAVLYCTGMYCIILQCTVLHFILLYCTTMQCTILQCTVHDNRFYLKQPPAGNFFHQTSEEDTYTVLLSKVMYYTVMYSIITLLYSNKIYIYCTLQY